MNQKSVVFWKKSLTRQCSKIRCRKVQFSSVKSGILEKIQHSALPMADPVGLQQNSSTSRYSILESPFLARERENIICTQAKCYTYRHVSPATDTYIVRMVNSNVGQQFSKKTLSTVLADDAVKLLLLRGHKSRLCSKKHSGARPWGTGDSQDFCADTLMLHSKHVMHYSSALRRRVTFVTSDVSKNVTRREYFPTC